MKELKGDSYSL